MADFEDDAFLRACIALTEKAEKASGTSNPASSQAPSVPSYAMQLNQQQREAVLASPDEPLLVIAGAGSGKTKVLCARIVHLLRSTHCRPHEIFAATFTRNAANEMRERLGAMVDRRTAGSIIVSTFHSFCLRVLREHAEDLDGLLKRDFSIFTAAQQRALVLEHLDTVLGAPTGERSRKERQRQAKGLLKSVHFAKTQAVLPDEIEDEILRDTMRFYIDEMRRRNAVDYSDLVRITVELFVLRPDVLRHYRRSIKYLLVDEFQDTNRQQSILVQLLGGVEGESESSPVPKRPRRVTVVGDDDQSIYGFGGASVANFELFKQQFEPVRVVKLERNYRSTASIVAVSNAVVVRNADRQPKRAWTSHAAGAPVTVARCRDTRCELAMLVDEVRALTTGLGSRGGAPRCARSDIAVLYRTNATGAGVQRALRDAGVPFASQSLRLQRLDHVLDVLALLRVGVSSKSDADWYRCLRLFSLIGGNSKGGKAAKTKKPQGLSEESMAAIRARAKQRGIGQSLAARELRYASHFKNKRDVRFLDKIFKLTDAVMGNVAVLALGEVVRRVASVHPFLRASACQAYSAAASASASSSVDCGDGPRVDMVAALSQEAERFSREWKSEALRREQGQPGADVVGEVREHDVAREKCARLLAFIDHVWMSIEEREPLRPPDGHRGTMARHRNGPSPRLKRDAVWCGTVHQAKGLEWKHVYVVRANEGEFPLECSEEGDGDEVDPSVPSLISKCTIEEERRIFYVALSRAAETLSVSYIN